ncbi:MAG: hypothetical protein AAFU70_05600, partial [Planctomycetota bacterium]
LSGAVCNWLDVPSGDAAVVRAAARQAPPGMWGDWPSMGGSETGLDWRAASVQTATPVAAAPRQGLQLRKAEPAAQKAAPRAAALALSDLPVRLLLDELDRAGVVVERVASLWHTMAAAWDPGASIAASDEDSDPLTARNDADAAVVLVNADGRLAWSWSSSGTLLAGGTTRLDPAALAGDPTASAQAAGRLSADWLAWTTQLARAPGQIVCLADDDIGDGIAVLGRAIGSAWPGGAIDLFRVPDPVGSTLVRLRETTAGGKPTRPLGQNASLSELIARPGRSHKAMYRWGAAALLAGAGLCVALGIQQRGSARDAAVEAASLTGAQRDRVAAVLSNDVDLTYPVLSAIGERDRLRSERSTPDDLSAPPPVLAGMEQIGFVVSSTGVRLERLTLGPGLASLNVSGESTEAVELLPSALRGGTDLFSWATSPTIRQRTGRYEANISGIWSLGPEPPEPSS